MFGFGYLELCKWMADYSSVASSIMYILRKETTVDGGQTKEVTYLKQNYNDTFVSEKGGFWNDYEYSSRYGSLSDKLFK